MDVWLRFSFTPADGTSDPEESARQPEIEANSPESHIYRHFDYPSGRDGGGKPWYLDTGWVGVDSRSGYPKHLTRSTRKAGGEKLLDRNPGRMVHMRTS